MKTLVLGDIHGRTNWKRIVDQPFDRIIFIGDYLDTHESITPMEQLENLREIIKFKQDNLDKVVLLIGNHDYHYWPGMDERYSGYQHRMRPSFEYEFTEFGHLFQAVYTQDDTLFSHAGITRQWLRNNGIDFLLDAPKLASTINELFSDQPYKFGFNGYDPYGDNITQGPLWVRPQSLMKNRVDWRQVVGHTTMKYIDPRADNEREGRYWFIDTIGTSGEYLEINDGIIEIRK